MNTTEEGVVKWYNRDKGYGFITRDNGDGDVMVRFADLNGADYQILKEGQRVSFEVHDGPKGLQAADVRIIS
ncbi:cold-shock protein [Laspinema sp. D1]|uniref:Cold-shock protein n=1 Tax=Laspinema palackyanum D2a TaxID=2953684 RepID=A0ABT2MZU9_9CYAN|nr:cold-shock protein [Laspinema sp. D2a]